tara:strand:+ start:200 stop:1498 length:1299 start_codon:yes stop_codon:yes gene_type:complete
MRLEFLAILLLIPSVSLGLVRGEKVEAEVLNASSKQMIISRGGSDAIVRGQFVRVLQDGRYKGRALAIQVLPYVSQWALYYQYEPISYALPVELKTSNPHPIPIEEKNKMNLSPMETSRLQAYSPKRPPRPVDDTKVDPEQERLDQQLALAARYADDGSGEKTAALEAREKLAEDLDEFSEDSRPLFDGWKIKAGIAPASFRRVGGEKALSFKTEVHTSRLRELSFDYQVETRSYRDQLSGQSFDFSQHKGNLHVDMIRLNERMSLFSYATFEKRQQGKAYPLRAHVNVGPLGLKYDFPSISLPWTYFDLSYVPTFDYQKSDYPLSASDFETRSEVGLRHTFRARLGGQFVEKQLTLSYEMLIRPMHETGSVGIDAGMTHLSSVANFDWKLSPKFSISYNNDFSRDPRRRELQGISATDMIHAFYINFNSDL